MSSSPVVSNDPFYLAKRGTYSAFLRFAVINLVVIILILVGMAAFLL